MLAWTFLVSQLAKGLSNPFSSHLLEIEHSYNSSDHFSTWETKSARAQKTRISAQFYGRLPSNDVWLLLHSSHISEYSKCSTINL